MSLYTFLYKGQVYDTVTVANAASAVNSSVPDLGLTCPPIAKPAIVLPVPPKPLLAKDKSFISVQEVPFQNSVFALLGLSPPNLGGIRFPTSASRCRGMPWQSSVQLWNLGVETAS